MAENETENMGITTFTQLADAIGNVLAAAEEEHKAREIAAAPHKAAKAAGKIDDVQALAKLFWKRRKSLLNDKGGKKLDQWTRRILRAQFQENTGAHFLDSGMYGRGWEKAAVRDFEAEPEATIRFDIRWREEKYETEWKNNDRVNLWPPIPAHYEVDVDATLSGYHAFAKQATVDVALTYVFYNVYAKEVDPANDTAWYELVGGFKEWLNGKSGITIYEMGSRGDNTYNYETKIDETFQYEELEIADTMWMGHENNRTFAGKYGIFEGTFWIMMTHNGADVRGGYSSPVIYSTCHDGYMNFTDLDVSCTNPECDVYWDTSYDSYNLYNQDFGIFGVEPKYDNKTQSIVTPWIVDEDTPENRNKYFGDPLPVEDIEPSKLPDGITQPRLPKVKQDFRLQATTTAIIALPKPVAEEQPDTMILLVNNDKHEALCPCCHKGVLQIHAPYYDC